MSRKFYIDNQRVTPEKMLEFLLNKQLRISAEYPWKIPVYEVGPHVYSLSELIDLTRDEVNKRRIAKQVKIVKSEQRGKTLYKVGKFLYACVIGISTAILALAIGFLALPCLFAGPAGWALLYGLSSWFPALDEEKPI